MNDADKKRQRDCMRLQSQLAEIVKGEELGNQILALTRVLRMTLTDKPNDKEEDDIIDALADALIPFSDCVEFLERFVTEDLDDNDEFLKQQLL